jgi:hypothetical protein
MCLIVENTDGIFDTCTFQNQLFLKNIRTVTLPYALPVYTVLEFNRKYT